MNGKIKIITPYRSRRPESGINGVKNTILGTPIRVFIPYVRTRTVPLFFPPSDSAIYVYSRSFVAYETTLLFIQKLISNKKVERSRRVGGK